MDQRYLDVHSYGLDDHVCSPGCDCGKNSTNVDENANTSSFSTLGTKWGQSDVLGSTGGVVTWSLAGTVFDSYINAASVALSSFLNFDYVGALKAAFQAWENISGIKFVQVEDEGTPMNNFAANSNADIRINGGYIDGSSGTLAYAFYPTSQPASNEYDYAGNITFDSGEATFWNYNSFYIVAMHEIGHSIGIEHSSVFGSLMYPTYNSSLTGLTSDDISAGRNIYGTSANQSNDFYMKAGNTNLTMAEDKDGITIHGTTSADNITTEGGSQTVYAGLGNDSIYAGIGNDTIYGGSGVDFIYGEDGTDYLYGGDDTDIIFGQDDKDYLYGESGNDIIVAGSGDDYIDGGADADTIYGEGGNDSLLGGAGQDFINGQIGNDKIYGGDDNDTLFGEGGDDTIYGDAGDDYINGQIDDDTLYGGTGNDVVIGEGGSDTLFGQDGNDILLGGSGDDAAYGGSGADIIYGEAGHDTLSGNEGTDFINGQDGNDVIFGGLDNDVLFGEGGNDVILGQDGDDTIYGQIGNDVLIGGTGNDTFVFQSYFGNDTIDDFDAGAGVTDVITVTGFSNFDSFAEILGAAVDDTTNTLITLDTNATILLKNVLVSDLHSDDFTFII